MVVVAACAIVLGAASAHTCEICREDKIAATYDWQVVNTAQQRGHVVVFTAIEGSVRADDAALELSLVRRLGAIPGVDAGSVRVSLRPPAASFATDPSRNRPPTLVATINGKLRSTGLTLSIVQVGAPKGAATLVRPSSR
jgi:hypothetical protein